MELIFGDDRTRIYCGNAAELHGGHLFATDGRVHLITDPPFDAATHAGTRTNKAGAADLGIDFAELTPDDMQHVGMAVRCHVTGWALVFCAFEQVSGWRRCLEGSGARWVRTQVWAKPNPMPQITGDRPAQPGEAIATAWAAKGRMAWNGGGRAGLYRHAAIEPGVAKVHPTQKPIALMRDLIELFTDPGDLVIDLFAGGGTTLRAARDLGRLSVGVEIRDDYARAAAARMGAGACGGDPSQPSLF